MRRFLLAITILIFSVAVYAQDSGAIRFMGIPVDGKKADMIAALQKKGFEYDKVNDVLMGVFNGRQSNIHVCTNHGVVDRIYIGDASTYNEASIRIEFNNLAYQFANNGKYFCLYDPTIPLGEDISYEMTVNDKQYQATFFLVADIPERLLKKLAAISIEEDEQAEKEFADVMEEAMGFVKGCVWFAIHECPRGYFLSIYYDNLRNRPHGEDL